MGAGASSIGVGTGRLTPSQMGQILTGTVSTGGLLPARIFVDNENDTPGFTINMSRASQEERAAFLRSLRGRSNTDNSQRTYTRVYREALAGGATATEALREARAARAETTRRVVDEVINRNRDRFPNIRTNRRRVSRR